MNPSAMNERTAGPDELQLPVLGLYADLEMGRGSVLLPDEFLRCSSAVRLEIIGAWQRALARYAHDALGSLYTELAAKRPQLGAAEHMAMFRTTCDTLGLTIPPGWVAPPQAKT